MKKKNVLKSHNVHKSTKKQKKNIRHNNQKRMVIKKRKYKKKAIKDIVPSIEPIVVPIITQEILPTETKRRGRKSKDGAPSKMYFTKDTEDSIIKYNATSDIQLREDIYNNKIKYPFEKLVENIFNTFKFSYFETGPLDVQKETVSHLVSNIHKFEAGKGKAFSYFSIIAKHYLIALNNSTYKRRNQHVEIGEEHDEHTVQLQTEDSYYKDGELKDFMKLMLEFWDNNINKIFTKERDLHIAQAVVELFRQTQNISLFNKKALYLYIREISNCKTQQITKIINKMRPYQTKLYKSYVNNGSIIDNIYDIQK